MTVECKNTIISGVTDVLVGDLSATEQTATSLGATNGGVTLTAAVEKTDVVVDQSLLPIRKIATSAGYTLSIPLAEITKDNLAKVLGLTIDNENKVTLVPEEYHQIWIKTKGVVNSSGKQQVRTFHFPKVSFIPNGELNMSRTDQQTITLEAAVVNCPTNGSNVEFMSVTDEDPE